MRTVAALPPTEPLRPVTGDEERIGPQRLAWLPSGDYVLYRETCSRGGLLVRLADGATTRVGPIPGWFVLNDDWALSHDDGVALNRQFQSRSPWPGESIRFDDLPGCVPRESANWSYLRFVRSPSDPDTALYIAWTKHLEGCCCTSYAERRYLGVVDLQTGRMTRLTWGDDHTIGQSVSWSADGSVIYYLRVPYTGEHLGPGDLHVIRPDGSGDRHLCAEVGRFEWLDGSRLLCETAPHPVRGPDSEAWFRQQQLAIVDVRSSAVQRLTKGEYHHTCEDRTGRDLPRLRAPDRRGRVQGRSVSDTGTVGGLRAPLGEAVRTHHVRRAEGSLS